METPPRTWPLPRAHDPTVRSLMPRTSAEERVLDHVRRGASVAVFALLDASQAMGAFAYVPALWDERRVPLCAAGAPIHDCCSPTSHSKHHRERCRTAAQKYRR